MSANPQHPFDRDDGPHIIYFNGTKVAIRPPQPKAPERDKVSHGSKDHEIENLKRLLADVSKRLDKLK